MQRGISACLIVLGLIHLIPLLGVLSRPLLESSYQIAIDSHNLEILMRHRALMFGMLGGFLLAAAWVDSWQWPALTMAAISMAGFIMMVYLVGNATAEILRVMWVDYAGMVVLGLAIWLKLRS